MELDTDKIPKPDDMKSLSEIIEPIGKYAGDRFMRWVDRLFGFKTLRAYVTTIWLSYVYSFTQYAQRKITYNFEDMSIGSVFFLSFLVLAFSVGDFIENKSFLNRREKQIEREKSWTFFVQRVDPFIPEGDYDTKLQRLFTVLGSSSTAVSDYIVKTVGKEIKEIKEMLQDYMDVKPLIMKLKDKLLDKK